MEISMLVDMCIGPSRDPFLLVVGLAVIFLVLYTHCKENLLVYCMPGHTALAGNK